MKIPVGRGQLLTLLMFLILVAGMGLAISFANPKMFWTNMGFMLSGTSIGVGAAVLIIKRLLDDAQAVERDRSRRILLRTVGHDCIGAIGRIFAQVGSHNFRFNGEELNDAWYFGIETGQISPEGFHSNLIQEFDGAAYGPPGDLRRAGNPPPPFPLLHDVNYDFEIGLMMLSRALGSAYARSDLFEVNELPTGDLESALVLLREAKSKGVFDSFEAAMLISPLGYAVEKSGTLLSDLGGFVEGRVKPKPRP